MVSPRTILISSLSLLVAGASCCDAEDAAQQSASPATAGAGLQFHLEVGGAWRSFGNLSFRSGSYSSGTDLPRLVPPSSSREPYGPRFGIAPRYYDDGYVLPDQRAGGEFEIVPIGAFPVSLDPYTQTTTGRWVGGTQGLVSRIVLDSFGAPRRQTYVGSETFHGEGQTSQFSQTIERPSQQTGNESAQQATAPVLEFTVSLPVKQNVEIGVALGFMFTPLSTERSTSSFRAVQESRGDLIRVTDTYATATFSLADISFGNNPPSFLSADTLFAVPVTRTETSTPFSHTAEFSNRVHESLDLDIYTASLGPTLQYHYRRLLTSLSTGLAVNFVDWQADYDERLYARGPTGPQRTIRHWTRQSSGLSILPGYYLQASAGVQLNRRWSVSAFVRYDWTEALSGRAGPSSFHSDLDGFTVGGTVALQF